MSDIQYVYSKERKEFGKQCLFADKKFLMVSIPPNHDEFNDYILRNPVSEGTQLSKQFALSEVNTVSTTVESKGILHTEGGWPKDINYLDSEQTVRYRRKLEKDETYITQVPRLGEVSSKASCPRATNSFILVMDTFLVSRPSTFVHAQSVSSSASCKTMP